MKILIINQILYTHADGIIPKVKTIKDTMIYQMCMGFVGLGHQVTLAASSEYRPTEEESYDFEIKWFDSNLTSLFPPTLLPCSMSLKKHLKKEGGKYDLIISKEVFSISSFWAATICPQKTLLWVEQAYHQRKFHKIPSKIWFNIIARLRMGNVKTVVPCSERAGEFLKPYLKKTTDDVVEHGIDIVKFKPAEAKSRQLMVSSQLIKRKNIESIIEIFANFHKIHKYKDVKLYIAGRGPEEQFLKDLTKQLHVEDSVLFLGFLTQAELNKYISESYAFLINTRADLNMVSVPESICSGTPVIMNEVPLTSWYVKKYNLGVVKNGWGANDIISVIEGNVGYVQRCKNYRRYLSIKSSAESLVRLSGIKA